MKGPTFQYKQVVLCQPDVVRAQAPQTIFVILGHLGVLLVADDTRPLGWFLEDFCLDEAVFPFGYLLRQCFLLLGCFVRLFARGGVHFCMTSD